MEDFDNDISAMSDYIEKSQDVFVNDLDEKILACEVDLQGIKSNSREMKREYEVKNNEMLTKMEKVDLEIIEVDKTIKQRQQEIADLEQKMAEDEEKKTNLETEIEKNKKALSDVEKDSKLLHSRILEKQELPAPKSIPKKKSRYEPLPKKRNWDSDSSTDGVNCETFQLKKNKSKTLVRTGNNFLIKYP